MDRKDIDLVTLRDELDRLDGRPPYNTWSNSSMGCPYFAGSLEKKYGRKLDELRKVAGRRAPDRFDPGPRLG